MNYKIRGQKSNILILHGGPGAIGASSGLAKMIGNCIEVYNYGQHIDAQCGEIKQILEYLDIKEPIIIGHSFGAWLAYIYASRYPVAKIILVGCGAFDAKYLSEMHQKRVSVLSNQEEKQVTTFLRGLSSGEGIDDLNTFNKLMSKMDSYKMDEYDEEMVMFDGEGHQLLMQEMKTLRKSGALIQMGKEIHSEIVIIHGMDDPHPVKGIVEPFDDNGILYKLYTLERCGHTPWHEHYAKTVFKEIVKKESKYLFQSERIGFRRLSKEDTAAFRKMNQNPEVMKYFPSILNDASSDHFLDQIMTKHQERGFGLYAVECLDDEVFMGFIGLSVPSFEMAFMPCVEIGWRLDHQYWHQGYATEGAKRVLKYAFEILRLNKIVSFTAESNQASTHVMEKIGMTFKSTFSHPKVMNTPLEKHVLFEIGV